jgi:Uma2 family endonuclease
MSQVAASPIRYTREDYRKLPEGPPHYELINGELIEMTRPFREHYQVAVVIVELLGPHARRKLGGELALEPNLYLPSTENVYHPDLAWVARERKAMCRRDGINGAPDMVCEILSSSTERKDRIIKLNDFERAGVRHVWLITPEAPVFVEEYVLGEDGAYRRHATVQSPDEWEPLVFPGWKLPLAELNDAVLDHEKAES